MPSIPKSIAFSKPCSALAQEDIEYINTHLGEWLTEQSLCKPVVVYELELCERMVRVEEELKHQRELIQQNIDQINKRFKGST